jgi:hypothetical protein
MLADIRNGTRDETFIPSMRSSRVYLYEQAHVNSTYEVSVWAETGGGEGSKRHVVVTTWPMIGARVCVCAFMESAEPATPDLAIDVLDAHTIRVTWIPAEHGLPGTGFYLNYTLAGSNVWARTEIQRLPITAYQLTELRPEQDYYVSVVSVDGDHTRASPMTLFRTRTAHARRVTTGERPRSHTRAFIVPDYMTSAAWFVAILCAVAVALCSLIVVCIRQNKGGKYPGECGGMCGAHTVVGILQ